ncbi:SusC/RagA family TonB-linked outer membrane protein [Terrimonas pollutisoli]|uniref:SusC/RagA family TonB-linked outer membrane protein n=1 Tax=Terrimonas pollutisoli TaxID=3034147 RepID=UPI0023ECBCC5|nr:TonB-dependent receptor [Terrimonas sp. H1YJ31]
MLKKFPRLFPLIFPLILLTAFSVNAVAQTVTVAGTVTGSNNEPLSGVTVTDKQSNNAVVSNTNGQFSIKALSSSSTLVFSHTGFQAVEVSLNGQTNLKVSMQLAASELTNVVVVGYGTQRKAAITGSVATVKGDELKQTAVSNLAQGLQARVAGVQVTQNSSAPGGNISVRVRGTNSLNGTSEPLYIVDGVQIANSGGVTDISPLSTINPNDIESIDILKDASATAIYGARGANGVVLITTKRGRNGATQLNFETYYGVQEITKKLSVMNASEFASLENQIYSPTVVYSDPASLGKGTDWQDLLYQKAPIQSHQLAISGGSDKTQFSLSGNYFDQEGIVIKSDFKRYSLRATIDHKINKRVKVGTSILSSYSINKGIPTGSQSLDAAVTTASVVGSALGAPPTLEPYRPDGTIWPFGEQFNNRYREVINPLGLTEVLNQTAIKRTLANVYGEVDITKGLVYRASFNTDLQSSLTDYYSPRYIIAARDLNANSGSASKSNGNSTLLLHESILTYSANFGQKHSLKFTGVYAAQSSQYNTNSISATGLPNDDTKNEALNLAVNRNVSSYREKQKLQSFMGRVNYGYDDKYLLTLTVRSDGASVFGENNKYSVFPAVSAAWRITQEKFMENVSWLNDLKLRASYGVTGNAGAISPYKSLSLSGPGSNYTFNHVYTIGISPVGISNPNLSWESSTQADIGLDLELFNNKVGVVIDYYNKKTDKLLFDQALPFSSGYSTITKNFGSIENKGWEFAVNARILQGDFKWNIGGNLTLNRNKILSIDGGLTKEKFANGSTVAVLKEGSPVGLFKAYIFDGIYQTGEAVMPGSGSRTGGTKVKDLNKDGQITGADQMIVGDPNADYIFGLTTNLSYKGFDLGIFLTGVQGNDIYNLSRYSFENPLGQRNVFQPLVNRWSPTNPTNEYVSGFQGQRIPLTDRFVEDGSFIRCKNISLGYNFTSIKNVRNIRVYVSAMNLFTITDYSGYDPEVNTYGNDNQRIGIDNLVYPNSRTIMAGLQIGL